MLSDYSQFFLTFLFGLVLTGCGMSSSAHWDTFADSLGLGSEVVPKQGLVNLSGIVEAHITKSQNPEWVEGKELDYPYAGIVMKFWRSGKSIDVSQSSGLSIEYLLKGNISMKLIQQGISPGREYRIDLPPQGLFQVKHFSWERFTQPVWVKQSTPLDLNNLTGLMFTNSTEENSTAYLAIKEIMFPDWENPYEVKNVIKNIGRSVSGSSANP